MIKPKISPNHKSHQELHKELAEAEKQIKLGGIYSHYKYPENTYKVINLGILEATDEICVMYQATYDKDLIFIRPIKSFLETPQWHGKQMPRFRLNKLPQPLHSQFPKAIKKYKNKL